MKGKQRRRKYTEERRHRMAEALKLRKQGLAYAAIGERLDVSMQQAYKDVQDALLEITKEPAQDVRAIELERSEEQHLRLNAEIGRVLRHLKASTTPQGVTDLKAVDQVRKLIETQNRIAQTRHRLNGFDMGIAVDASINVEQSISAMFETIMGADESEFSEG
ncbi:hypothetical protein [Corynebacterium sp.]|uniref:hypothetical protein n=1 Tax=Corynebacterium sp. TaxID=1720 RepID=UPI002A915ABF|nr:hypothetical protein [Corynebacterium sp.]MDY5785874.1 hypothetical protein [Corynebacterium sp.]